MIKTLTNILIVISLIITIACEDTKTNESEALAESGSIYGKSLLMEVGLIVEQYYSH